MEMVNGCDYEALFRQYVIRGVRTMDRQIQSANDAPLNEQTVQDAWHVLDFGLKLADAWPWTRDLLMRLAPKLEQAGYRDDWLSYLEAGITASQQSADGRTEAELRLHAGHLDYLCSRFARAEEQLHRSLTLFQIGGDTRGQARAYNELAWLNHLQHRYAEATEQVKQALALLAADDPERAMSYRVQGMIAIYHKRGEEAEIFHRQALALFEKQRDRRRIAGSIQNLATALREQKRFEEAISYYQQAVKMLDQLDDIHSLGIAEMNLGTIKCCHLNRPGEGLIHYQQASLVFNQLHDKLNIARVNTGLGLGYLGLKQYTEAENVFLSSIQLFAELKNESLRLNATDGLVMVLLAAKQYKRAASVAEQALHEVAGITNAPNYTYLLQSLTKHLAEARQGLGIET